MLRTDYGYYALASMVAAFIGQCSRVVLKCQTQRESGIEPSAPTREAYEALLSSARAPVTEERQVDRPGRPSLVGRLPERRRLTALWRAIETDGTHLVLVTGEPGIGKSRLVEELRAWCIHQGALSASARSYAAEGALACAPLVAWLRAEPLKPRLQRLDRARLSELARLLPELLSEMPDLPRPDPLPESDQRQRLFDAAVEAGAELRERFLVQDLVWDGDRVSDITGGSSTGTVVTERARIVIGADGVHSLVARQVGAPSYNTKPTYACAYYSYWCGVPLDGVEFYPQEHRGFGALPTHSGLTTIIVGWPHDEFHAYRADVEGDFLKTLELGPAFAQQVRQGRREERFTGTAELFNFFRRPHGPGWALVGDAGYHKDPITTQGISDAFRDAELVA